MPDSPLMRPHKRCWLILTAGRWPWKSEPAKECVTTHLPNQLALKMDGAGAADLYSAPGRPKRPGSRKVVAVAPKARSVNSARAAVSADLG